MQVHSTPARPLPWWQLTLPMTLWTCHRRPSHHLLLSVDLKWTCHRDPGFATDPPDLHLEKRQWALFPGLQARTLVSLSGFIWEVLPLAMERTLECSESWTHSLKSTHWSCGGHRRDFLLGSWQSLGDRLCFLLEETSCWQEL